MSSFISSFSKPRLRLMFVLFNLGLAGQLVFSDQVRDPFSSWQRPGAVQAEQGCEKLVLRAIMASDNGYQAVIDCCGDTVVVESGGLVGQYAVQQVLFDRVVLRWGGRNITLTFAQENL